MSELVLPLVSICIPTYNRAGQLERAMSSAMQQDYGKLEIIVVDNASTDDTAAIVRRCQQLDSRIAYKANESNIGAVNNFNTAISFANGDYVMWLADDDWIDSHYISTCMDELLANPSLLLVSGFNEVLMPDGEVKSGQSASFLSASPVLRLLLYFAWVGDNGVFYGVHRKSTIESINLTNKLGGDWFFVAAIAFRGRIKMLPGCILHRSGEGASTDLPRLARELNQSFLCRWQPYLAVALGAGKQILVDKGTYGRVNIPFRYLLASIISAGIIVKKVILQGTYRFFRGVLDTVSDSKSNI